MGAFLDIRPGEGPATLASGALFFFVVASYYLIKPVRNSLFVERVGADNLPYVYIATAVIIGLEDRIMMTIVERVDFLRTVEMFSLVRTEYLAKIAAVAKERALADGEVLFEQETPPEAIYFVLDGEIRATRTGEEAWVAGRGQAVGALPVLDRKPTPVSATAVGAVRVLFVDDEVFNDLMQDNPALPLGIVRYLAGEVRRLLEDRRGAAVHAYS